MSDLLWVKYELSPVMVLNNHGDGHNLKIGFDDNISAEETFPATSGSSRYKLVLSKNVDYPEQVRTASDELVNLLKRLSLVWTFAGGARMELQTIISHAAPKYSTNGSELLKEMLARKGQARLSHSLNLIASVTTTYNDFPLANAKRLLDAAVKDFHLNLMLEYYNEALLDEKNWFIHLYKIRDSFDKLVEKHGIKNGRFGLSYDKWNKFGKKLNTEYDLRHAPQKEGPIPVISREEKEMLFNTGREMITHYFDQFDISHY